MTDPVPERPILPTSGDIRDLIRGLFIVLSGHAVRSNQTVPKDGSELVDMQAYSHVTLPIITATQNNYDLGAQTSVARISSDASPQLITGIADGAINAPGEGRVLSLINVGAFTIHFLDDNILSLAENRMKLGVGGVVVSPDEGIALWYDKDDLRWRRRATY